MNNFIIIVLVFASMFLVAITDSRHEKRITKLENQLTCIGVDSNKVTACINAYEN